MRIPSLLGKGDSIWDTWAHAGNIANGDTGDTADDSYKKYMDDIKLLMDLGVISLIYISLFPV